MQFQNVVGVVTSVSTGLVAVSLSDADSARRIAVGGFCAIADGRNGSHLIALVDSVSGSVDTEPSSADKPSATSANARMTVIGQICPADAGRFRFKRGAESFPALGSQCFALSDTELGQLLDAVTATFQKDELFELGAYSLSQQTRVRASGNRFFQRHAAIVGSTGAGKSWAVALLLERASQLPGANLILFDLHGEYKPLSDPQTGFATRLRIAGPGDLAAPGDDVLFLPHWLLSRDEMFSVVADIRQESAYNQAARFAKHIFDLKTEWRDKHKLKKSLQTFTLDSPIPYSLDELIDRLEFDNNEMVEGARSEKKGPWNGTLTKVLERFRDRIADRRNGFLFQAPESSDSPDWLTQLVERLMTSGPEQRGIKIIDFSEVPADLLAVAASTLARLLYTVQFWLEPQDRRPMCLVCDEAHLYLPRTDNADAGQSRSLETFERIAKEGRKYGVSLLVVSQRPSDLNSTILSQCNNFLSLRLSNDRDQSAVRNLLPDSMKGVSELLPILDIGEALLIGDAVMFPTRIRLDAPSVAPSSASIDFWLEWQKGATSASKLAHAIENLRRQGRKLAE